MRIDNKDTYLLSNEHLSEEIEDKEIVDYEKEKTEKDENLKDQRKKFFELLNIYNETIPIIL